ncbi:hypothetical protein RNJ44_00503 [Nakaseomyces bracarensis]|uniref:DSC E3 ubiquitin ligase complex subunit 3 C-terminal domain-containing protein n=1 Tax=Nakaseomyces bracarensis TaxID=273131 RepID=A0ABR4NSR7_9SACH
MSQEPLLPRNNGDMSSQVGSLPKYIVIRFSDESVADLKLNISQVTPETVNTQWLRRLCRELRSEQTSRRRLRFIRDGNVLNSSAHLGNEITRYFDRVTGENDETLTELLYYIHCVIGTDIMTDEQLANEDALDALGPSEDAVTTQAIGFDRLRSVGFNDEEIELLRQQFRMTYGDIEDDDIEDDLINSQNSRENGSAEGTNGRRDIRQLEEIWMESGVTPAEGTDAPNWTVNGGEERNEIEDRFNSIPATNIKHNWDLLIGITTGFCLGIFALLLMRNEGLFNKRQRMSIIIGVVTNVLFCLVRAF